MTGKSNSVVHEYSPEIAHAVAAEVKVGNIDRLTLPHPNFLFITSLPNGRCLVGMRHLEKLAGEMVKNSSATTKALDNLAKGTEHALQP